jgi:hypothetical protein
MFVCCSRSRRDAAHGSLVGFSRHPGGERAMGLITELWPAGDAPAWDGLYWADGSARVAEVDGPGLSRFRLGAPRDLAALLAGDPGNLTAIAVHPRGVVELPDGSGRVCCGDGSLGSEGFFARLDADGNLVWPVSLGESGPFVRAEVAGSSATFINNLGNAFTLDLAAPEFAAR